MFFLVNGLNILHYSSIIIFVTPNIFLQDNAISLLLLIHLKFLLEHSESLSFDYFSYQCLLLLFYFSLISKLFPIFESLLSLSNNFTVYGLLLGYIRLINTKFRIIAYNYNYYIIMYIYIMITTLRTRIYL